MILNGQVDSKGAIKSVEAVSFDDEMARLLGVAQTGDAAKLYAAVDWMFRCVTLISGSTGAIPMTISRMGAEEPLWDSDTDDMLPAGLEMFANLPDLVTLMSAAYPLLGRAYIFRQRNVRARDVGLRWLMASSIEPIIDVAGLQGFYRTAQNGVRFKLPAEDVVYAWWRDPLVELGEPQVYPGRTACAAAGVLANMDTFLASYFKRGMIKATLLVTKGIVTEPERERAKSWWQRVTSGNRNAFATEVINGDQTNVVQIGDGLSELGNAELTAEKREAISTAFGVPHSLVMSNAATYATAQQDVLTLYQQTVIPQAKQLSYELNKQLFHPLGYDFRFEFKRVEALQSAEVAKAQAVAQLVGPGKAILTVNEARELLGYDAIEGGDELAGSGPVPEQLAGAMPGAVEQEQDAQPDTRKDEEVKRLGAFIRNGKYLERAFKSDILTPGEIQEAIRAHEWANYP